MDNLRIVLVSTETAGIDRHKRMLTFTGWWVIKAGEFLPQGHHPNIDPPSCVISDLSPRGSGGGGLVRYLGV